MRGFRLLSIFLCVLMFGGCAFQKPEPEQIVTQAAVPEAPPPAAAPAAYKLDISTHDIKPGKYEPRYGCYLGAYALEDAAMGPNGWGFEAAAQKPHALYAWHMFSGGAISDAWLLECVARQKTPFVTVRPPAEGDIYDEDLLADTARRLGAYNLPVFVNLYPYARGQGYEREAYLSFYRRAKRLFAERAPNAALVWTTDLADAEAAADFCPDEADWVGASLFMTIRDGAHDDGALDRVRAFHNQYQTRKPVLITAAVSHFTTARNRYYTNEAAERLAALYALAADCPRLKAVVYMDMADGRDDYTVTGDDAARDAYRAATGGGGFLSEAESPAAFPVTIRAALPAYYHNGAYYAAQKSLAQARLPIPAAPPTLIDGERCYPLAAVNAARPIDFYISADDTLLTIETRRYDP